MVTAPYPPGVTAAVCAAEDAMIDASGWHHVQGIYYASLSDAAIQRRRVAERQVRDATRRGLWVLGTRRRETDRTGQSQIVTRAVHLTTPDRSTP